MTKIFTKQALFFSFFLLGSYILYVVLYYFLIVSNCDGTAGGLGYAGYTCWGYYNVLQKIFLPLYSIFTGISLYFIVRKKIKKDYCKMLFLILSIFIALLLIYIFFTFLSTPTDFKQGIPM